MGKENVDAKFVTGNCGTRLYNSGGCAGNRAAAWIADRGNGGEGKLDTVAPSCVGCPSFAPSGINYVWVEGKRVPMETYKLQQGQARSEGVSTS